MPLNNSTWLSARYYLPYGNSNTYFVFLENKNLYCLFELKHHHRLNKNNLLIIFFFFLSHPLYFFQSDKTFFSFIIGQNQLFNQSTNPIANNFRTRRKKKGRRKLMSLTFSHFLSHECFYLISRYISIEEENQSI